MMENTVKRILFSNGLWNVLVSLYIVKATFPEEDIFNATEIVLSDCWETNFSSYNLELLPTEWDTTGRYELQLQLITVKWSYSYDKDYNLRGFKVWFTDPDQCKLVFLNVHDQTDTTFQREFKTSFSRPSEEITSADVFVKPLVAKGSIKYVQWEGATFLSVRDHDIKVVIELPKSVKLMVFYLYQKGVIPPITSQPVDGSIIVVKNLTKGFYQYQFEIVESINDSNCPCYVEALGRKECRQCERKMSFGWFCVPIQHVCDISPEDSEYEQMAGNNAPTITILLPVITTIGIVLAAVSVICCIRRCPLFCCKETKSDSGGRLIVLYQSGSHLHEKLVRQFSVVLSHRWYVEAINDDGLNSHALFKYDRNEIFKILILAGGHGTRNLPQRFFNSTTDCSTLLFIPVNWSCRPIIVSYLETSTDLEKCFPEDLQKFDLSYEFSGLISHLSGTEFFSCPLSKMSLDIRRFRNSIRILKSKIVNDRKRDESENAEMDNKRSRYTIDEEQSKLNFIPPTEDTHSLFNDIVYGININCDQSSVDYSLSGNEHQESISIGGKSV